MCRIIYHRCNQKIGSYYVGFYCFIYPDCIQKIYEDCSLTFFVSSVHSSMTELRTAYLESVLIQKNRYVIPQNSVLMYDKLKHFNKIRFHATQSIDDLDILATMEDIVDSIKQETVLQ